MVVIIPGIDCPGLALDLPDLTASQSRFLMAIMELTANKGFPPTIRELVDHLGFSSLNSLSHTFSILKRKGCILRNGRKARTIRFAKPLVWVELEEKPLRASTF
ncbi:MAG: hypothetical protein KGJ09_09265 [Candidatus Omnitrophica bacterium]|nr:hypothetical protein [Candidatus Omnitrophota bacterium]